VGGDLKHMKQTKEKFSHTLRVVQDAKNSIIYSRKHTCLVYILALRDVFAS
jgi:hypothetical protein